MGSLRLRGARRGLGWYTKSWPPLALAKSTCTLSRVKKTRCGRAPSGTAGLWHRRRLDELTEQTVEHCEAAGAGTRRGELGLPRSLPGDKGPHPPLGTTGPAAYQWGAHLQQAPLERDTSPGGCGRGPTAPPRGWVLGLGPRRPHVGRGLQPHRQQGLPHHVQARAPDPDQPPAPASG